MVFSAILIHAQLGRIEMHFHIFVAMAFLLVYVDWKVVLASSAFIAIHHAVVNYLQSLEFKAGGIPVLVFNYGCGWDIVALHAFFVIFEATVLIYLGSTMQTQMRLEFESKKKIQETTELVRYIFGDVESNSMAFEEKTKSIVHRLREFLESFQTQSTAMEEISAGTEETASSSQLILENSNRHAKELDELISTKERSIEEQNRIADHLSKINQNILSANNQMKMTQKTFDELIQSMETAVQDASSMEEILSIINDIADRTNLLSLNASIEAARAGDAGRGFAVVAQEVSKLADSTSEAIKNISQISSKIWNTIHANRDKTNEIKILIQEFLSHLANQTQDSQKITQQILSSKNQIEKQREILVRFLDYARLIQTSSKEQSHSMEEIAKSISEINQTMQSNLQWIQEITESVQANQESFRSSIVRINELSSVLRVSRESTS